MRPNRRLPLLGLVLVAALGFAALGGCGGGDGGTEPLDATTVDSQGCDDWNAATTAERQALVTDLGYAPTAVFPDAVDLIVEGVDNFCTSPGADPDLGLGGAISGTALAIGLQPAP